MGSLWLSFHLLDPAGHQARRSWATTSQTELSFRYPDDNLQLVNQLRHLVTPATNADQHNPAAVSNSGAVSTSTGILREYRDTLERLAWDLNPSSTGMLSLCGDRQDVHARPRSFRRSIKRSGAEAQLFLSGIHHGVQRQHNLLTKRAKFKGSGCICFQERDGGSMEVDALLKAWAVGALAATIQPRSACTI